MLKPKQKARGTKKARQMLADYVEPKLPDDVDEALRDFIERRIREIPETLE